MIDSFRLARPEHTASVAGVSFLAHCSLAYSHLAALEEIAMQNGIRRHQAPPNRTSGYPHIYK